MSTLELHPEVLKKDGRKHSVVLPYHEYLKIQEELEDLADIRALDEARRMDADLPGIPLAEVKRRLKVKFQKGKPKAKKAS